MVEDPLLAAEVAAQSAALDVGTVDAGVAA